MKNSVKPKFLPIILVILDGWGIAPASLSNPISLAKIPTMNNFNKWYPHTQLTAHGQKVGLPNSQDGNSESGHMNIGAGRIVVQDAVHIFKDIKNKTFFQNKVLIGAVNHAKKNRSNLHVIGLLSNGESAHAQPGHLFALLKFLQEQNFKRVYLHLFTDGRDTPTHTAGRLISKLINNFQNGEIISTVMGRFYAMDRIKSWRRTELAYNAMVLGHGLASDNPYKAISEAYNRGETDEFITPTIILNPIKKSQFIDHNDSVIFFNLRSDRARQLAKPFVQRNFAAQNVGEFKRKKILKNLKFVAFTDFGPDLDSIETAFHSQNLKNTLPAVLKDFQQLYISEREKYAHVTYFFNGGYGQPINGEEWQVIASSGRGNYEKNPQMSSDKLTSIILKHLKQRKVDFIVVNYPNADMLGHTGNIKAAIKALEFVDKNLARLYKEVKRNNGTMIITADHGNVEEMINLKTGEMDTEHSMNPVPFILVNNRFHGKKIAWRTDGVLGDIAPTILQLLQVKKPADMTGKSLFKNKKLF